MEKFLDTVSKFIIKNKFFVLAIFIIAVCVSAGFANSVKINDDMTKYMPNDSSITKAIEINSAEFGDNEVLNVMISGVASDEVGIYKSTIQNLSKVEKVSQKNYKDNAVLFSVTLRGDLSFSDAKAAVSDIRTALADKKIALEGHVVTESYVDEISSGEATKLLTILIPVLLLILVLSSKSFIDPLICLIVLIVSTVIGMGTNAIFSDISSITNNMFSVLMIAISMDYSIFMLHTFKDEKEKGRTSKQAVLNSLKKSFTTITSASLTTIAGFIAMAFIKFTFGADIGWVFAKGILISLLTAILLIPCLLTLFDKLITKTAHKNLMPSFKPVGRVIMKSKWAVLPIALVMIVGGFFFTQENNFVYGNSTLIETKGTPLYEDNRSIVETFGRSNNLVVMMPTKGNTLRYEYELTQKLANFGTVAMLESGEKDIISLATIISQMGMYESLKDADFETVYSTIDIGIRSAMQANPGDKTPQEIDEDVDGILSFIGQNKEFVRIVVNLSTAEEADETFATIEKIREIIPSGVYLLGASSVALEMKEIVNADYMLVTLLTIAAIGLIVGLAFKSWSLPIIMLLCVQGGVFINMAIPALSSQAIPYVAYLLISTIQLAVTIDYSILITTKYMANRKKMGKKDSAIMAIHDASGALITGGGVLMAAGFAMYLTSGDVVVAQMGMLLGRGALISLLLAFAFLPAMLTVFDKLIKKSTHKTEFLEEPNILSDKKSI